jgi:hypothetical protein
VLQFKYLVRGKPYIFSCYQALSQSQAEGLSLILKRKSKERSSKQKTNFSRPPKMEGELNVLEIEDDIDVFKNERRHLFFQKEDNLHFF